jgi:hypothetical protein
MPPAWRLRSTDAKKNAKAVAFALKSGGLSRPSSSWCQCLKLAAHVAEPAKIVRKLRSPP